MVLYSHSRINTYETCPLAYKFNYIDKIKTGETGIEAFMGSRVHETFEKLYTDINLSKENSLEDLLTHYNEIWNKNYDKDLVKIVRKEYSPENYRKTGEKAIKNYYNRYHPFDQDKTLAIEKLVLVEIEGHKIRGYIDRLAETEDGVYQIHDYKTSQRVPEQKHKDADRQLALYQIAIQDMWNDVKDVSLIWHYVVPDKTIISKRSEEDLETLKHEIAVAIEAMNVAQETNTFEPKESALCRWCDYQNLCPKRKHIAKTNALPLNKYFKEPGVKLVNEFRDLKDQLTLIKTEISKVEEALIAFADKEDCEIIRGSDNKVKVTTRTSYKMPKDREKLEALLKKLNHLEEVKTINYMTLNSKLKSWDDADKVKSIMDETESTSVRLSKLNEKRE